MVIKQTRDTTTNELYVAEKLGVISGELAGIKKDLEELKNAIIPLKKQVYMISGGVGLAAFVLTLVAQGAVRYMIGN
jgi:archaellum component FlaC